MRREGLHARLQELGDLFLRWPIGGMLWRHAYRKSDLPGDLRSTNQWASRPDCARVEDCGRTGGRDPSEFGEGTAPFYRSRAGRDDLRGDSRLRECVCDDV